jgi:hypothetical protein
MSPYKGRAAAAARDAVLAQLRETQYDFSFRTINCIAEATGLTPECVASTLKELADVVRESAVRDAKGNALFTLRSRPRRVREVLSETRGFLTGSTR